MSNNNMNMVLKQKEDVAVVKSFTRLIATMTWTTAVDFDLAAVYETKTGEFGLVYFGELGNLNAAPFMELDGDEGVGDTGGENAETLRITNLDMMKTVWLVAWDFEQVRVGQPARFEGSDVAISIADETGQTYSVVFNTGDLGNLAVLAKIDNTNPAGAQLQNISKCGTLKEFNTLAPIVDIVRAV